MRQEENQKAKLICDHCHHVEPIDVADINIDLIGRPCPVCYESMFTAFDWRAWKRIQRFSRFDRALRRLFPWLKTVDVWISTSKHRNGF